MRLKETTILFFVNALCVFFFLYNFKDGTIPLSFVFVNKTFEIQFKEIYAIFSFFGILIAILTILIVIRKPDLDMGKLLKAVLTGEIGSLFGLVGFISGIVYIGWITDYLREKEPFYALVSFELLLINVEAFVLLLKGEEIRSGKGEPEPKRILIFALSKPNLKGNLPCKVFQALLEMESKIKGGKANDPQKSVKFKHPEKGNKSRRKFNWEVPLRSVVHHMGRLERIYVLVSDASRYEEFKEGVLSFLSTRGKEVKMESTQHLDFDDYNEILTALLNLITKAKRDGYSDDDFSFNISGGTSAVTAALIIAAIKEGRQAEYVAQTNVPTLRGIDVNEIQVKTFLGRLGIR